MRNDTDLGDLRRFVLKTLETNSHAILGFSRVLSHSIYKFYCDVVGINLRFVWVWFACGLWIDSLQ